MCEGTDTERKLSAQAAEVRVWLLRMRDRMEIFHARGGAAVDMRRALLQVGCSASSATVPSDLRCWYMTLGAILQRLGKRETAVLMIRLTSRSKSAEGSWETIATRVGISTVEAREIFRRAVPAFLAEVKRRELELDYHEQEAA